MAGFEAKILVEGSASAMSMTMEVRKPQTETTEAFWHASKLGEASLELINCELVSSQKWSDAVAAEQIPTLFSSELPQSPYVANHVVCE